jgi:hypothetical protein
MVEQVPRFLLPFLKSCAAQPYRADPMTVGHWLSREFDPDVEALVCAAIA